MDEKTNKVLESDGVAQGRIILYNLYTIGFSGKRTSARVNFGTRTSAHVINFGTRILHGAEVKISTELGAEFNIWCRSLQLSAEVTRAEHR